MGDSDWGEYFSAKKSKLNEQLNNSENSKNCTQLFQGIEIYINGYTNPPEPVLREIFINHGGQYCQYFSSRTTFVIATNLPAAKKRHMGSKTLKPDWITDSILAGVKLDPRKYFLYNSNEENNQKTLTQVLERHTTTPLTPETSGASPYDCSASSPSICLEASNADSQLSPDEGSIRLSKTSSLISTTEDGFLEAFYNKSRLHLISTMKKETQHLVAGWKKNASTHEFSLLREYLLEAKKQAQENDPHAMLEGKQQIIFHIDIDCFFVAVGRLTRPHLLGLPVAVTHSKGTGPGSKSEIACVSYEGRSKGVSAGMWLDEAKRLCPELQTIPYEFEEYKRVSGVLFETVASLTLDIEAISCDELYINATNVLGDSGTHPTHLANFLRSAFNNSAGIVASIGIGSNKLSARIATRQAKENGLGICQMTESDLNEHIRTLPVQKLPGVGYSTTEKLNNLHKIETCGDLQRMSLQELKQSFGEKTGEKLYWLSRGVDRDPIQWDNVSHQAKSISAGCSFGVRFTTTAEINTFIKQLSAELSKRAAESECYGKKITLSLWVVRKGFINEPVKPGAHGVVDINSRTRAFHVPTRDVTVISNMSSELVRSITKTSIPPNYIRGVRISLDNLCYESAMRTKEKKSVQSTIESSFSAKLKQKSIHSQKTDDNVLNGETVQLQNTRSETLRQSTTNESQHGESVDEKTSDEKRQPADANLRAAHGVCSNDDEESHDRWGNQYQYCDITELDRDDSQDSIGVPIPLGSASNPKMVHSSINPETSSASASLDSMTRDLPYLNGVSSVADVKCILRGGIASKHMATQEDAGILAGYLQELIGPGNHLKEGRELIFYAWELICELQANGEATSLAWAKALLHMLRVSEDLIYQKYGERLSEEE